MPIQSSEDPEVIADRLYQIKDYNGAVKWFTKAIEQNSEKLHQQIYLKRAAALIKLEKFGAAVQDAGNAVRLAPQSPEGYLRLSQVLQRQGNNERAIAILEAGLSRMKAGSSNWKSISEHLDQARVRLNLLIKRRDFFDREKGLPIELVIQIFGYLEQKEIFRCMRVCRGWRTAIRNNSEFFQSLSIRRSIPRQSLNRWLNLTENSAYKLINLSLAIKTTDPSDRQTQNLFGIAQLCRQLKSIRLNISDSITEDVHKLYPWGSPSLEKLFLDGAAAISMTDIETMMSRLPGLKQAEFHVVTKARGNMVVQWPEMPHLEQIVISGHRTLARDIPETMLGINKLIAAAPNVKHAVIKNFGRSSAGTNPVDFAAWRSLQHLDIERLRTSHLPTFPPTLRYLDLSEIATVAEDELQKPLQDGTLDASLFHLPELVHLNVEGSDFSLCMYELSVAGLASGTLEALYIGDTSHFSASDDPYTLWPLRMPGPSDSLRVLSLQGLTHISEDLILHLLGRYPNLDEVDLSETIVTGTALRKLFEREHKPHVITIVGCTKISRDAAEAARHHCIDVVSDSPPQKQLYNGHKHRPHDF